MTPELIFFALRSLVRVGSTARSAYEQSVRDRDFPMPQTTRVVFDDVDAVLIARYDHPKYRALITKPEGPLAAHWGDMGPLGTAAARQALLTAWETVADPADRALDLSGGAPWVAASLEVRGEGVLLLRQWSAEAAPVTPGARIALAAADVVLEYVGANPGVLGIGGSGEKLIGAFAGNLRALIPDLEAQRGPTARDAFAQGVAIALLHAGFKTLAQHAGALVEEKHLAELIRNIAQPLADAVQPDGEGSLADLLAWDALRETLLPQLAEAAFDTLARHQEAFLGRSFDPNGAIGALTRVVLEQAKAGGPGFLGERQGQVALFRALLDVVATRPNLFVPDGKENAALLQGVIAATAESLAAPGLDLSPAFGAALAVNVLEAVNEALPPTSADPWHAVAGAAAGQLAAGLAAGRADGGHPFLALFSEEQAADLLRTVLLQVARTPGMIVPGSASEELKAIVAGLAKAAAAEGSALLGPDGWRAVAAVAAEEAAKNPGRLFGIEADDPEGQLAVQLIRHVLAGAAAEFRDRGRAGGAVLFGDTLREAIAIVLRAAAGRAARAAGNLPALDRLLAALGELTAKGPEQIGAAEWLRLFRRMAPVVLETGDLSEATAERLRAMLAIPGEP